jgi:carnitine 3-dehydrogenase
MCAEKSRHLTDRLQEAMRRDTAHGHDGVATTGELDESIIYGPGLRWAAMGMNLIYHWPVAKAACAICSSSLGRA